jgi:hypothetical protein
MYPLLDLDQLRVHMPLTGAQESLRRDQRPPRHRSREKFLKGPIPLAWLEQAGRQPGKALHVGVALWFLCGVAGHRTVALSAKVLTSFGLDPRSSHRALASLERVHLVTVQRHRGRQPRVTLLEASPT